MVHTTFNSEYHFGKRSSRQVELFASESNAKLAWALPSAANNAKNCQAISIRLSSNVVQTRAEPSLLGLCRVQSTLRRMERMASISNMKSRRTAILRQAPRRKHSQLTAL